MTRIICVGSGKGGAGKTTITSNLAGALSELGYSVVAVDGNLSTSNLSIHFGIPRYPHTIQDVIKGKAKVEDSIYTHPSGLRVIPAHLSLSKKMIPSAKQFIGVLYKLVDESDFILLDSAAGLGKESLSAVECSDELLIVTNPDLPAITDALKLVEMGEKYGTENIGVVVNRVKGKKHEIPINDIEDFIGVPILGVVPEDENIRKAVYMHQPLIFSNPGSASGRNIMEIAAKIAGEDYNKGFSFRSFFSGLFK